MYGKSRLFILLFHLCYSMTLSEKTCGAHYTGELFEEFHGGESFVSYEINSWNTSDDYLLYQDRFCTRSKGSAAISAISSREHREEIVLEIMKGEIGVQLIKDGKPECLYMLNETVNDGTNHKIEMELKGIQLRFHLYRGNTVICHRIFNISSCLHGNWSSFRHLERGGMKYDGGYLEKPYLFGNFEGCMGDTMINGIPLAHAAEETERNDVDRSCYHVFGKECTDMCATTYILKEEKCVCPNDSEVNDVGLCRLSCNCINCQNGGSCIAEFGSDSLCRCSPGYKGLYCEEKVHPCVDVKCLNGGYCSAQPSGPSCICPPDFTGSNCEVPLPPPDPCASEPCQNNATCKRNGTNQENYHCSCLPGYDGNLCEIQVSRASEVTPWTAIILPGVLVVGLVIGIAAFLFRKNRRRFKLDSTTEEKNHDTGHESEL